MYLEIRPELAQSNRSPSRARRAGGTIIERAYDRAVRHLIVRLAIAVLIVASPTPSPADSPKPDPVVVLPFGGIVFPVPAPPSNADPMNPASPGDVLTQRYNNLRTGATLQIGLDRDAVRNGFGFIGILGSADPKNTNDSNYIDGVVSAQPLFMEKVKVKGKDRSAVFIATSTNMVYAFDADTLDKLWETPQPLGTPYSVPHAFVPDAAGKPSECAAQMVATEQDGKGVDTTVVLGIESTPVIDFVRSRIIVSYRKGGANVRGEQHIVALKLEDGTPITDRAIESNPDNPLWNQVHRNRASLLLDDNRVYVAFSGLCEEEEVEFYKDKSYQGWIYAFDAETLAPMGKYRTIQQAEGTPPTKTTDDTMQGAGIWQATTGLASDGHGNLYFATGNQYKCTPTGDATHIKCSPPDAAGKNLSDSIIRLRVDPAPGGPPGSISMTPEDWFTPYRKTWLDWQDLDFAAGGVVLIPNTRYLVAGGKEGMLYVLDRDNLGKFDGSVPFDASTVIDHFSGDKVGLDDPGRDQVVQKFQAAESRYCADVPGPLFCLGAPPPGASGVTMTNWNPWPHIHGTPVFGVFPDGRAFLYLWAEKDFLKSFQWRGKRFDTTPTAIATNKMGIATNKMGAQVLAPPYLGVTPQAEPSECRAECSHSPLTLLNRPMACCSHRCSAAE